MSLITGVQPKAGAGHKMQSISVVFSTLHFEGYIGDLRYRWLITSGSARWNTRAKRLRMRKVSIFKLAVANANFTTRMPVFELKSNFISIQNFKAGNFKPPGMHWSKDF